MKEVSTISKRKSRSRPQNRRQQPRPVNKGYGDAGASWHKKATKGFRAMSGSPKEDIDANNYTLRQRARMLYMAAPIATSAIRTNRTNVVGIGLQLKSRIDREALGMTQEAADAWQAQAEREFALWSENKRACDATGVNNFAAMQQLALSSWLVSGDVFAVVKQYEPTPLTPYSLRLHLIEADRVATPTTSGIITPMLLTTGKAANGNTIYDGVEVNDDGQIEAYHIRSTYPFELGSTTTTWARVQAYGERTGLPNILHVMESERPDQYRGVSYLAQVIEPLLQLRRYTESELTAAVVESFFTAFIKTEAGAGDNPFNEVGSSLPEVSRDPNEYEMGPGQINIMEPGEDVTFADPKRPASGFNTFLRAICEQVGAALEIPADLLLKSFNSSYSASRAALMEAWKAFRMRRKWFVDDFCTPVYEIWLSEAVARGRISAPGFFADPAIRAAYLGAEWIGPSQGQLDPTKEITAEILAIGEGITTREQATIRLNGGQWDANVDQLTRENEKLRAAQGQVDQSTAASGTISAALATDASYPYKLVNPAAFSLFVPSKDRTPPNIAAPIPSVCVQIVQGDDDLLQSARDIKIRLCFSAWDPGYHGPDIFKPKGDGSGTYIQQYNEAAASYFVKNGEGWRDAWNFVDTALRLIENAEYLGDLRVIKEKGITFGSVAEQDAVPDFYPYWFAWAEFSVEETLTRNPKSYQHLL